MRTFYTLLLFLLCFSGTAAQDNVTANHKTKEISKTHPDHTAKYTVLEDNPGVKHGPYEMVGRNWRAAGEYEMDKRAGVWSFYGWNNKLEYQYDFSSNKELYSAYPTNTPETEVYLNGAFVKTKADGSAFYFGGSSRMMSFLAQHIRYPAAAQRAGVQGTAVISMEIDEAGNASNFAVAQKVGYGIEEEALRVVRMTPSNWIPAMLNGKPIKSKHYVPVRFIIHNQPPNTKL